MILHLSIKGSGEPLIFLHLGLDADVELSLGGILL